eukprot:CAMPEP_0206477290 /NCGR_PEP_ID=MMETSP0324_2-20121206/35267_1 /ASSEMBLY_ACC=CAM_ASM_000836 /TAXON_ID=2866 /ORGANISM="Crypthecodinium cohnii, Strain Seligo" /LENGTH=258 /DNA_ID=CAMNT_0053953171 /DNA_START=418 /DNA_END=1194 /DNA_ORIENTATION=-
MASLDVKALLFREFHYFSTFLPEQEAWKATTSTRWKYSGCTSLLLRNSCSRDDDGSAEAAAPPPPPPPPPPVADDEFPPCPAGVVARFQNEQKSRSADHQRPAGQQLRHAHAECPRSRLDMVLEPMGKCASKAHGREGGHREGGRDRASYKPCGSCRGGGEGGGCGMGMGGGARPGGERGRGGGCSSMASQQLAGGMLEAAAGIGVGVCVAACFLLRVDLVQRQMEGGIRKTTCCNGGACVGDCWRHRSENSRLKVPQ